MAKRLPSNRGRLGARARAPAAVKRGRTIGPKPDRAMRTAELAEKIAALQAQLRTARRRIADLEASADSDALLGVLNRRGFERELRRSIAYVQRYGATAALVYCDVDRLKPINDRFGHAAGDAVLTAVARALGSHVRVSDLVGRLGGDEFGIILWNLTEADARIKAEGLARGIAGLKIRFRDQPIAVSASFGLTVIRPNDEPSEAIERADRAMYDAKANARR
jgi:diguanylate cyclase (GGDEF)-like protein